jgi:hypothetical protein
VAFTSRIAMALAMMILPLPSPFHPVDDSVNRSHILSPPA